MIVSTKRENSIFFVYNPPCVQVLTRLRLLVIQMNISLNTAFVIQLILRVIVELKSKLVCTSSCFIILTLLKDKNPLMNVRKLTEIFSVQMYFSWKSKTNNLKAFNQNITKIVISYLKTAGRFDRLIISFGQWNLCLSLLLSFRKIFVNLISIYSFGSRI